MPLGECRVCTRRSIIRQHIRLHIYIGNCKHGNIFKYMFELLTVRLVTPSNNCDPWLRSSCTWYGISCRGLQFFELSPDTFKLISYLENLMVYFHDFLLWCLEIRRDLWLLRNIILSVVLKKPTVGPTFKLLDIFIHVVKVASDDIEVSVHQDIVTITNGQKREICWHYAVSLWQK